VQANAGGRRCDLCGGMWSGQRKKGGSEETINPSAAVESFHNLDHDRVKGPVDYKQSPPAGGDHASIWQNCGFYSEPVRNETAVHSVEHKALWITYRPGLAAEQVDKSCESWPLARPKCSSAPIRIYWPPW
jgi:Protein of unknown function (DUF3105)